MILFTDTFNPKYQDRTNGTKNQTSHDTFGWYSTPKYQVSSIEMVVLDTFGPKYRERHFDTFSRYLLDAWPFFLFAVLSDGNAGSIPAWDIYFRWPYAVWTVRYRTVRYSTCIGTVRYGTVPYRLTSIMWSLNYCQGYQFAGLFMNTFANSLQNRCSWTVFAKVGDWLAFANSLANCSYTVHEQCLPKSVTDWLFANSFENSSSVFKTVIAKS